MFFFIVGDCWCVCCALLLIHLIHFIKYCFYFNSIIHIFPLLFFLDYNTWFSSCSSIRYSVWLQLRSRYFFLFSVHFLIKFCKFFFFHNSLKIFHIFEMFLHIFQSTFISSKIDQFYGFASLYFSRMRSLQNNKITLQSAIY